MSSYSKNEKSRGLVLTIAAAAGLVGYVLGIYVPVQKSIAKKRQELKEKRLFIATTQIGTVASAAAESELKISRTHVDRWREAASGESGETLLGDLAAIASETGVALHRLAPQEPAVLNTLRQQTLNLEVEGSFVDVIRFLEGVEKRPETIWVPGVDLQASAEDTQKVQCMVSLVVFADNRGNSG